MKNYPEDIFEKPLLYRDKNNRIRVRNWDIKKYMKGYPIFVGKKVL